MISFKVNVELDDAGLRSLSQRLNKTIDKAVAELIRRITMRSKAIFVKNAKKIKGDGHETTAKSISYKKVSDIEYKIDIKSPLALLQETGRVGSKQVGDEIIEGSSPYIDAKKRDEKGRLKGMIVFNSGFEEMRYNSAYVRNLSEQENALIRGERFVAPDYDFDAINNASRGQALSRRYRVHINRERFIAPALEEINGPSMQAYIDSIVFGDV